MAKVLSLLSSFLRSRPVPCPKAYCVHSKLYKYVHFLHKLQWVSKVYILQKDYIVFPPPPFLHPNINLFLFFFFLLFSKYSPFSKIPQLFSPLPIFLGFFNLVKKSCFKKCNYRGCIPIGQGSSPRW